MKNLPNKKGACLWALFLGVTLGFTACGDDIHDFSKTTPADEAVSIYIADSVFTYTIGWDVEMEYTGTADTVIARFPVHLTEAVEHDVAVTLMVDDQLRVNYNTAHDINYKTIPASDLVLRNTTVTIPAGKTQSDSLVTIVCKRALKTFLDTTGYLIPVRMRTYKGGGVKPNYEERHSNLFINVNRVNGAYFANPVTKLRYVPAAGMGVENGASFVPLSGIYFNVSSYWAVSAEVNLQVNNDLIAAYNASNGTNYQPVPGDKLVQFDTVEMTSEIPTKSFTLDYSGDIPSLNDPRGYLIPLEITSVTGDNISKVTSKSIHFVQIDVSFLYTEVVTTEDLLGTVQPQAGYSVIKATNANTGANLALPGVFGNLFDGNRGSMWNGASYKLSLVIDLGQEVQDITGLSLWQYSATTYWNTYWLKSCAVSFATEAMYQEGKPMSMGTATQTKSGQEACFIKFGEPITARYIYLENMTGGLNANYIMISEFNIYK
ncbi:MAG: DUF1735 domain-containing protein [Culturomica sp.]|jgi:hypothetical protein|nr:DUF1735 domain-containing protein [Culturomica sp.]